MRKTDYYQLYKLLNRQGRAAAEDADFLAWHRCHQFPSGLNLNSGDSVYQKRDSAIYRFGGYGSDLTWRLPP
jgi:hypothetical protein